MRCSGTLGRMKRRCRLPIRQNRLQSKVRDLLVDSFANAREPSPSRRSRANSKAKKVSNWDLPPQRFEFVEEKQIQVGDWRGVEQSGHVQKPKAAEACHFYRLPALVPSVQSISKYLLQNPDLFSTELDSVDKTPTFEFYPFRDGEWIDQGMRHLLEEILDRVMVYVRLRYDGRCAASDILVRRYLPGERRSHGVHFDGHALVTAVLGLTDPETYQGGLYVQPGPDVTSRTYFRLEPGDLLVHSFDLQHGVHVWEGARYSIVFWIKDSAQAVRDRSTPWYRRLEEQGDADVLFNLAQNFEHGLFGEPVDLAKALELYELSAGKGHHFAQNNLGLIYRRLHESSGEEQLLRKSVHWLKAAAEAGFAMAQKNLALAYANGQGLRRDDAQAVVWMRKAAEQLEVEAAYMMGEMYRRGCGVSSQEGVMWYLRSAEAGFPKAQYTVGMLYLEGSGLSQDLGKAETWLKLAAKQGNPEAKNNVATLHAQRGEVAEASQIWEELAKSGEPNAQCNLGMAYLRGAGRPEDPDLAAEWLRKAAQQGHQMALQALATL
ncbi:unnamed protein product [Effrenium voratum]|uniref:Fe2OG dioxygenase domain-containing protein n=1 Tax=Effrenium voratum TaxID=2562239 RepID=A0AA36MV41_9DINO|nr:unnamed protein product [Effrenium voratum]